jgi:hypothetical protein
MGLSIQTSLTGVLQDKVPNRTNAVKQPVFIEHLFSPAFFNKGRKSRALLKLPHRNLIRQTLPQKVEKIDLALVELFLAITFWKIFWRCRTA